MFRVGSYLQEISLCLCKYSRQNKRENMLNLKRPWSHKFPSRDTWPVSCSSRCESLNKNQGVNGFHSFLECVRGRTLFLFVLLSELCSSWLPDYSPYLLCCQPGPLRFLNCAPPLCVQSQQRESVPSLCLLLLPFHLSNLFSFSASF